MIEARITSMTDICLMRDPVAAHAALLLRLDFRASVRSSIRAADARPGTVFQYGCHHTVADSLSSRRRRAVLWAELNMASAR
ncbi:hypothetical protein ADK82_03890 [Streptomyces sp. NRRL S-4]|nr:hypothetical protein ADK82_03890 [Streptomyces sp. NRRL S-4]